MNMQGSSTPAASETLIADFRATRVQFTSWGVRRALSDDQKTQAADAFGADAGFLSAGKKIIDTKHKAYSDVTKIKSRMARDWHELTLPYPEPGLRLIRESDVLLFAERMEAGRASLLAAVDTLQSAYLELKVKAQIKLGTLYNSSDYPATVVGLFDAAWEFPNVTPPDYLRVLNPALYEQERQRIVARFDEAVTLAEQAFVGEFEQLVSHLAERLTGTTDKGELKTFKDSTITNLSDFFGKFSHLSIKSNDQLESLVAQAQSLVNGVSPASIRPDGGSVTVAQEALRNHIAQNVGQIAEQLQGMMINRPRRRVVRPNSEAA
ncbi:MAG: hypothetical protein C0483_18535 [Pirellula sp.]|nr:hypothetical protein [Pirellula sp.]